MNTVKIAFAAAVLLFTGYTLSNADLDTERSGSFFIDPRDGKKYRTVKIGKLTWMAWNLKSRSGWVNLECGNKMNGTDNYGFSALPAGVYSPCGTFSGGGEASQWWTATEGGEGAYIRAMLYAWEVVHESTYNKSYGFSVRCVQK
jgi:hypothetical protein